MNNLLITEKLLDDRKNVTVIVFVNFKPVKKSETHLIQDTSNRVLDLLDSWRRCDRKVERR